MSARPAPPPTETLRHEIASLRVELYGHAGGGDEAWAALSCVETLAEKAEGFEKALRYIADGSPWKDQLGADSILVEYEAVAQAALDGRTV